MSDSQHWDIFFNSLRVGSSVMYAPRKKVFATTTGSRRGVPKTYERPCIIVGLHTQSKTAMIAPLIRAKKDRNGEWMKPVEDHYEAYKSWLPVQYYNTCDPITVPPDQAGRNNVVWHRSPAMIYHTLGGQQHDCKLKPGYIWCNHLPGETILKSAVEDRTVYHDSERAMSSESGAISQMQAQYFSV